MGCLPVVAMILVQVGFAGMSLLAKMALDDGMSPYVLIAYRSLIAATFVAPFAVYFERNSWTMISKKVITQVFVSATFGMTLCEILFFLGFQSTSATVASALGNMVPALTFAIAAALKMEAVRLKTHAGQAKVAGTVVCLAGSMIMTLYKGPLLVVWRPPVHWRYAEQITAAAAPAGVLAVGVILIILSNVAWASWLVMQNKASEDFSAPYTSTTIMSLIVGVECAGVSAAVERSLSPWKLVPGIRLYSELYMGIVGWGITFAVMTWCIRVRGPLFVSMFNPVVLVVVAVLGWAILGEQLHVGSAIGSVLIVAGLYMVLWGKGREVSRPAADLEVNGGDGNSHAEEH